MKFVFNLCPSRSLPKYTKTRVLTTFFTSQRSRAQNHSSCVFFYMIFKEKYFSLSILLSDQISLPECLYSGGKQSNPGHFLKAQGKFFLSLLCTLFYIFLTSKNYKIEPLKRFLRSLYFLLLLDTFSFYIFLLFECFLAPQ